MYFIHSSSRFCLLLLGSIFLFISGCSSPTPEPDGFLNISGIYPHLAAFNQPEDTAAIKRHMECGIGAVVPWAGKLWYITYPPHQTKGSNDKLYEVDSSLNLSIHPNSVGGTHANRMIHRESEQLIIGPYFISQTGEVRVADVNQLVGRMTATFRHLTDPENLVYFYDMEGAIYEVNVHTLAITKLFEKAVPGWHGKGGYTAQRRIVIANNGERASVPKGTYDQLEIGTGPRGEEAGVLAEWDGKTWKIVERKQFTDVTGPGGLSGNANDSLPLWSMGWDKRSVILKLLDQGKWSSYRMPKGSHTFDPRHGWYTEWPRIRQLTQDQWMMVMHGSMFDFPAGFSAGRTGGIRPIATHLRYIPDFCSWQDQIVLAADDASFLQNPLVGQAQSNLWFGEKEDLEYFGPKSGWGGIWLQDEVEANTFSDPFLIAGYQERILHLAHMATNPVQFSIEIDETGKGNWKSWQSFAIPAMGYFPLIIPEDLQVEWIRIKLNQSCRATAYVHAYSPRRIQESESNIFKGLVSINDTDAYSTGIIRPAGHNRSLQFLSKRIEDNEQKGRATYREIALSSSGKSLEFSSPNKRKLKKSIEVATLPENPPFGVDGASVIYTDENGDRYRLPKGDAAYSQAFAEGWPRAIREAVSERFLANIHGTFYEIPRAEGESKAQYEIDKIKPIASHRYRIADFCTWRGLFVMSGVQMYAEEDGHIFKAKNGSGVWMGMIDDLWKMGKPKGIGSTWKNTQVKSGQVSDPYLMTGYDQKSLEITHTAQDSMTFNLEIDVDHQSWYVYKKITVQAGEKWEYEFPKGFHAHWIRIRAKGDGEVSATFVYE